MNTEKPTERLTGAGRLDEVIGLKDAIAYKKGRQENRKRSWKLSRRLIGGTAARNAKLKNHNQRAK